MIFFPDYLFIDDSTIKVSHLDNVVREEMSNGMNKTKLRQSFPIVNLYFEVSTQGINLSKFNNWFRNDLRSGTNFFLMRDPITGNNKKYRFLETEISWDKIGNLFSTAFILEAYSE